MVGDRYHRHVAEFVENWLEIGQIQAPVQRRELRFWALAPQGKVHEIGVKMQNIEMPGLARDLR
jgi:hypothetical protein